MTGCYSIEQLKNSVGFWTVSVAICTSEELKIRQKKIEFVKTFLQIQLGELSAPLNHLAVFQEAAFAAGNDMKGGRERGSWHDWTLTMFWRDRRQSLGREFGTFYDGRVRTGPVAEKQVNIKATSHGQTRRTQLDRRVVGRCELAVRRRVLRVAASLFIAGGGSGRGQEHHHVVRGQ